MRTQVAIIGAGPAGPAAGAPAGAQRRHRHAWCWSAAARITCSPGSAPAFWRWAPRTLWMLPASVQGCVPEGLPHDGIEMRFDGRCAAASISRARTGGKHVLVYGQTELTRDLMEARAAAGARSPSTRRSDVPDRRLTPGAAARHSACTRHGKSQTATCDFIAGCDGFHGVTRAQRPGCGDLQLRA